MPIVKCNSHLEVYQAKAKSLDPNELSGRTGRADLTDFICHSIISHVTLEDTSVLVDVGCGNGVLLQLVAQDIHRAVGVLPSNEEVERVKGILPKLKNVEIYQGLAQSTGLSEEFADIVVCNGVLILLSENEVEQALKELVRISKPGAQVFIGEIPSKNEHEGKNFGNSITLWLWWVLRKQGLRAFFRQSRQTLNALFSNKPMVIMPKKHYFSNKEDFIKLAEKSGLQLTKVFKHREVTSSGEEYDSDSRWDYIFIKPLFGAGPN